jgi:succinylglutamate desuccinylase
MLQPHPEAIRRTHRYLEPEQLNRLIKHPLEWSFGPLRNDLDESRDPLE